MFGLGVSRLGVFGIGVSRLWVFGLGVSVVRFSAETAIPNKKRRVGGM